MTLHDLTLAAVAGKSDAAENIDACWRFVPLEVASVPPNGLIEHLKDRWWIVHPEKGVVFFHSKGSLFPQCNTIEAMVRRWQRERFPWAEVRLIPSVFRRINPNDYVQ